MLWKSIIFYNFPAYFIMLDLINSYWERNHYREYNIIILIIKFLNVLTMLPVILGYSSKLLISIKKSSLMIIIGSHLWESTMWFSTLIVVDHSLWPWTFQSSRLFPLWSSLNILSSTNNVLLKYIAFFELCLLAFIVCTNDSLINDCQKKKKYTSKTK